MTLKNSVANRFSLAAPSYHQKTPVHKEIASDLLALLPTEIHAERILELGCGTGALTGLLLKRFPRGKLSAVDFSAPMLLETSNNLKGSLERLTLIQADARSLTRPDGLGFDLITSSSAIQWMRPLSLLFEQQRALLNPGGVFCFALMTEGCLKELREVRSQVAPGKPAPSLPDSAEISRALSKARFKVLASDTRHYQTKHSSARGFLEDIHKLGFTAKPLSSNNKPLIRKELESLISLYQRSFSTGNAAEVYATLVSSFYLCILER